MSLCSCIFPPVWPPQFNCPSTRPFSTNVATVDHNGMAALIMLNAKWCWLYGLKWDRHYQLFILGLRPIQICGWSNFVSNIKKNKHGRYATHTSLYLVRCSRWTSGGEYTRRDVRTDDKRYKNTACGTLTLRWLMSYIYGAPILDVSRSHTTTQHSR